MIFNYSTKEVIEHLKLQGFFFQNSEIYGGLANSWDYGPLGNSIKRNLKKIWWDYFVDKSKLNIGFDSSILMNNNVWKASGHLSNFFDLLLDCKNCKSRFRPDKLINNIFPDIDCNSLSKDELLLFFKNNNILCLNCNKNNFTDIRNFGLMFKTNQGSLEDNKNIIYLRPELAQGIFINFKNIQRTFNKKLPFGVGQIGKSFRNEITPGNFIFRTYEFEQMELEFFFDPEDNENWFNFWLEKVCSFLLKIGLKKQNFFLREHSKKELAHYSKRTIDIEYNFEFGKGELWGISDRGDYDLYNHMKNSKIDLLYFDQKKNKKIIPHVIEPSVGVGRLIFALLYDSYFTENINNKKRIVLKLNHFISPYKIAILPFNKVLNKKSYFIFEKLLKKYSCIYDDKGTIGKRYRKQDAIGTPYCITYDFQSLEDNTVTIRNRDDMKQIRINLSNLESYFFNIFDYYLED